jgi:hypothetical protein
MVFTGMKALDTPNITEKPRTTNYVTKAMEARAKFWEKALPILEAMPASRFTRSVWKFTGKELPRTW